MQDEEEFDDQDVLIQVKLVGCSSVGVYFENVASSHYESHAEQVNRNLLEEYLGSHRSVQGRHWPHHSRMRKLCAHQNGRHYDLVDGAQVSHTAERVSRSLFR